MSSGAPVAPPRPAPSRPRPATILLGAVLVAALALFAWHAWALRFADPPPWPDEALFADPAAQLARTGVLGTTLFRESVPSTVGHYDLYPPLYLLVVALVFSIAGPSLLAMRMTSVAIAAVVLLLIHGIARRAGLGRPSAMGAVSLAAADLVLMRAAHIGRMEILTLALVLVVVWLGLGGAELPERSAGRRAFAMGVAAGLAFLSHPLGWVATPVAFVLLVSPRATPRAAQAARAAIRPVLLLLLGIALALAPWAVYALQDPGAFVHQFGVQFARKLSETRSSGCVDTTLSQWPLRASIVAAVLVLGLVGLAIASWRSRSARGLALAQVLIAAAVISGCEQWYAVCLVPLTCVGLARLAAEADTPGARGLAGVAALIVASVWALVGVAGRFALTPPPSERGDRAYQAWCRRVEDAIPPGSRVILDLIPTPYFGFSGGRLEPRLFRLAGFQQSPEREGAALDSIDFVLLGRNRGSRALADSVAARGTWVASIPGPGGAVARVYRMHPRRAVPGQAPGLR